MSELNTRTCSDMIYDILYVFILFLQYIIIEKHETNYLHAVSCYIDIAVLSKSGE